VDFELTEDPELIRSGGGAMRIAPASQEMVLAYLGSHVLGLPRSY
jgi:hypothetical protein